MVSLGLNELKIDATVNTLRPKQNRRHFAESILKFIFLKENLYILIPFHWRLFMLVITFHFEIDVILWFVQCVLGLILDLHPANERRRYKVTPSLIDWAETWYQPCIWILIHCSPSSSYHERRGSDDISSPRGDCNLHSHWRAQGFATCQGQSTCSFGGGKQRLFCVCAQPMRDDVTL